MWSDEEDHDLPDRISKLFAYACLQQQQAAISLFAYLR